MLVAPAVAAAAPPPNDQFSSPVILSGATDSYSGNNSEANIALQPGEPNHAEWTDGEAARSVWFRWQAPAGVGETTISLCESAPTADSVLVVYTGSTLATLERVPRGRSDDGCGVLFGPSEVTFTPIAGTTYQIVVADWDFDDGAINGPYKLDLFPTPPPPDNDDFENAHVLSGQTDGVVSNNRRATMQSGEPDHSAPFGGNARRSVWFRWSAPAAGQATISLCDSGETDDSVVAVYVGNALSSLGLPALASDDDGCGEEEGPSEVTWTAAAGTVYRIAVADWDPDSGIGNGYELDFTFEPDVADPPPETQITSFLPFERMTTFGAGGFDTTVTQPLSIGFGSPADDLSHFECLVDGKVVDDSCASPFADVDPPGGPHTFAVRAVDLAGNADPTPATQAFEVDRSAPSVSITGGPQNGSTTSDTAPQFTVATEAGATLVCKFDGGDLEACSGSTFETPALSEAEHTVEVWAIDAAGNVGGPASRTFTVVSAAAQECLEAEAVLAAAESDLEQADGLVAKLKQKLRKAKRADRRNRIRKVRTNLKAARQVRTDSRGAVSAAADAVALCDS